MQPDQRSRRFAALPDEQTLAGTVAALEDRGFAVEIVDDLNAACSAALARIPEGARVMTNTSVTLQETGIDAAINESGRYECARNAIAALDRKTQLQEIKAVTGHPDFSVEACTQTARAQNAYGQPSLVGKLLEIHREPVPGRIHIVLIRQQVGF